jgi:hypothetical protein
MLKLELNNPRSNVNKITSIQIIGEFSHKKDKREKRDFKTGPRSPHHNDHMSSSCLGESDGCLESTFVSVLVVAFMVMIAFWISSW